MFVFWDTPSTRFPSGPCHSISSHFNQKNIWRKANQCPPTLGPIHTVKTKALPLDVRFSCLVMLLNQKHSDMAWERNDWHRACSDQRFEFHAAILSARFFYAVYWVPPKLEMLEWLMLSILRQLYCIACSYPSWGKPLMRFHSDCG